MTAVFVACLVGACTVLAILAGFLLWWLAHARFHTRGVVGNKRQIDAASARRGRRKLWKWLRIGRVKD